MLNITVARKTLRKSQYLGTKGLLGVITTILHSISQNVVISSELFQDFLSFAEVGSSKHLQQTSCRTESHQEKFVPKFAFKLLETVLKDN